jgi:hypothetical protein
MKKILDAARRNSDYEIESKVLHEQFYDKALHHNGCICKYFMKTPKQAKKQLKRKQSPLTMTCHLRN